MQTEHAFMPQAIRMVLPPKPLFTLVPEILFTGNRHVLILHGSKFFLPASARDD